MLRALAERGLHALAIGREEDWVRERMVQHRNPGKPFEMQNNDGRWFTVQESKTEEGGIVAIRSDITERKRAEKSLRESEERFRDIATTASDRFWEMDQNLRFTSTIDYPGSKISPGPGHFIGHTRWEAAGADIDNDEKWRRHREDHLARRPYRNFDFSLTGDDGVTRHLSVSGNPVFASNGAFKGYRGSATDITERKTTEHELLKSYEGLEMRIEHRTRDLRQEIAERKRAEDALRQGEQRLNAILSTAAEGIITIDQKGVIQSFNAASERMFGYPAGEVLGGNVKMLMPAALPRYPLKAPLPAITA